MSGKSKPIFVILFETELRVAAKALALAFKEKSGKALSLAMVAAYKALWHLGEEENNKAPVLLVPHPPEPDETVEVVKKETP